MGASTGKAPGHHVLLSKQSIMRCSTSPFYGAQWATKRPAPEREPSDLLQRVSAFVTPLRRHRIATALRSYPVDGSRAPLTAAKAETLTSISQRGLCSV